MAGQAAGKSIWMRDTDILDNIGNIF